MKNNVLQQKSYAFAIKIVECYKIISKKDIIISRQLLKSGTSIGANIEESIGGQSNNDFISKIYIAYKEARETKYWLNLLKDTNYLDKNEAEKLLIDCEELLKIMGKIISTLKLKIDN